MPKAAAKKTPKKAATKKKAVVVKAKLKTKAQVVAKAKKPAAAPKKVAPKAVVQPAKTLKAVVQKVVEKTKSQMQKPVAPPQGESVFARLLREKKERQALHSQNQHHTKHHDSQSMPADHARYARFAGPRRRAS